MTNARRDGNFIPTKLAILDTDNVSLQPLYVTPAGRLKITYGGRGAQTDPGRALRDENRATSMLGTAQDDGITPVPVYADSLGHLLVK